MFVDVRYTAVDVVPDYRYRQNGSYHGAPPSGLSRYVDSQVTAQMGIRFLTFVILSAGINMAFVVVFGVVVSSCIFHGVSPCRLLGCRLLSFLHDKLATECDLTTGEELVLFNR